MAISIKVATDLYRQKVNYIVDFPCLPSMHALKVKMEALFTRDIEARRYPGAPLTLFKIDHIQIFEPKSGAWIELDSTSLLTEGCQLYVFQPPSEWHDDTQGGLPPAARPPLTHPPIGAVDRFSPSPMRGVVSPPPVLPVLPGPPVVPVPVVANALAAEAAVHASVALGELVESTTVARAATVAAEHEVAETNHMLAMQEARTQEAARHADGATMHLTDVQRKTGLAREQYSAAVSGVEAVKNSERIAALDHSRLVDQVHAADARCQAQETEMARSQHRLTEIARLVAQQKLEVDHHRELAIKCTVDLETAQTRVAQQEAALEAAKAGVEECEKQLDEAKADAEAMDAKLQEADERLAEAKEHTGEVRKGVTEALTALTTAKEEEAGKRQEQLEAQHQVALAQTRSMVQDEETAKMELKLKEVEGLFKMQQLEVDRHKELSERCRQELEDAKQREEEAGQATLEAQRAVHKAEDDLTTAERALEKALITERDAHAQQVMAQSEVDRAKASVAGREAALERAKEREKMMQLSLEEAKADVVSAEVRKTTQDAELVSCEERLVELEKLAAEQMLVTEQIRDAAMKSRTELLHASESEKQTAAEVALIQTMVNTTQDELLRKRAELAAYQDLENEAVTNKMQAEGERAAQLTLMSATEKQLFALREKEGIRRAAEDETLRAAELQSRLTRSLEREQVDLATRRLALEHELSPALSRQRSPRRLY